MKSISIVLYGCFLLQLGQAIERVKRQTEVPEFDITNAYITASNVHDPDTRPLSLITDNTDASNGFTDCAVVTAAQGSNDVWIQIDMGQEVTVSAVEILPRSDGSSGSGKQLADFYVYVGESMDSLTDFNLCTFHAGTLEMDGFLKRLNCDNPMQGRAVIIKKSSGSGASQYLTVCEVNVLGTPVAPPPGCFPGNAMVTTPTGNIAMETLSIGDSVLTVLDNEEMGFTKVVSFTDRKPDQKAHFLSLTTVNPAGHTQIVKLTATHNIYVKNNDDYVPRFAEEVFVGDVLATMSNNGAAVNEATVTHVALHKEMGVYNPLTETGTMLVDGTLVSCYGSFSHYLSHLATAPLRWFPKLFADEDKPLDGTLPYVETIKYIARSYIAPIVSVN